VLLGIGTNFIQMLTSEIGKKNGLVAGVPTTGGNLVTGLNLNTLSP